MLERCGRVDSEEEGRRGKVVENFWTPTKLEHAEIPAASLRHSAFIGGAPYNSCMGSKIFYDVLVPK